MKNTAQTIAFILSIFCVIVLLASMAGIALTWEYHRMVTEDLLPKLDVIKSDLLAAQSDLQTVKSELDAAQTEINALQATLKTLGIEGAGSLQALSDIVGKLEGTFTPFVTTVAEKVESLRNSLLQVKGIIEKLNQLPLVNIEIPGIEQIDLATASLLELQTQIETGRDKVSQASQVTQNTIDDLTTGFADLEASVQTLSASLGGYYDKISAYLVELNALQENLPRWADWAAAALTFILAWLGISQLLIFMYAWQFSTGQDFLAALRDKETTSLV
jgi:chromosome segregation ATPase